MPDTLIADRYVLQHELGAGGMGTVYKGLDIRTNAAVAIKQLKPDLTTPELIERFKREGEALRDLNHPNIVKMLDAVEVDGSHYLVMEYLPGGDLKNLIQQHGKLDHARCVDMAIDLADALTRAHRLNIIHRDLKPANVLIGHDGTVRLSDFGIAYMATKSRVTNSDAIIGTVDYLSPEALNGEHLDSRADIWAFGVMLFEMLTGKRPFAGETLTATITAILTAPLPDLEASNPDLSIDLVDLVYRMLERDPHARIASVRHVGAALEDIAKGRSTIQPERDRFETPVYDFSTRARHNLPAQTTPFVGREHELIELDRLIRDPHIRLITILAPGGMGKTRLALEAGEQILPHFEDGVYFVELAPLSDPNNIVFAIGEATGYQFQRDGREPKRQVLDFLSNKAVLLIMDNYEHLLDGAGLVTDILHAAPKTKVLVTARQRLMQSGETTFDLKGMDFGSGAFIQPDTESAAIQLFLQSGKRARYDFEVTEENASDIEHICRLVHGSPLGIVLAANWIKLLNPGEIADEIRKSIDFLDANLTDLPERQRSIRSVFDYSWNLLAPDDRVALMKLSVFRGGFTREAALAVTDSNLRVLMTLVNNSLVDRSAETGRYSIHELTRQYCEEKLIASKIESEVYNRHQDYFLSLLASLVKPLKTDRQLDALNTIEREFENVRAAWLRGVQQSAFSLLGEGVESLFLFTNMRQGTQDVMGLIEIAAAPTLKLEPDDADTGFGFVRLQIRRTLSQLIFNHEIDFDEALLQIERAERLLSDTNVSSVITSSASYEHFFIHYAYWILGNRRKSSKGNRAHAEQVYAVAERVDDRYVKGIGASILARASTFGDEPLTSRLNNAIRYEQIAYDLFQSIGNRYWMAAVLGNLANHTTQLGAYDRAEAYLEEALPIHEQMQNQAGIAHVFSRQGDLNLWKGEYEKADACLQRAERILRVIGNRIQLIWVLDARVTALFVLKHVDEAVRIARDLLSLGPPGSQGYGNRLVANITPHTILILADRYEDVPNALYHMAAALLHDQEFDGVAAWYFVTSVIRFLTHQQQYNEAIELLALLLNQPQLAPEVGIMIEPTWAELREELDTITYDAAWKQGQSLNFGDVIRALYEKYSQL